MVRSHFTRRNAHQPSAAARPAVLETLEGRQLLSTSGLNLVETRSTLPTAVLSGATIKGIVQVQVTNSLTTPISGPQTFDVYASTDGTIDSASTVIGTVTRGNLKLGASRTTVVTIPVKQAAPPVGDYAVFIQSTDGTGNVSDAAGKAPDFSVAAPYVSLTANVGVPKPTALTVDHAVAFKVTVLNTGNIISRGTISAAIELSTDGVNVTDTLGTPQVRKANIKEGGKAVTFTYKVKVDDTGTFYIGGTFTSGIQVFTAFSSTAITVGTNAF